MNTRLQSALKADAATSRPAKQPAESRLADASELLLAELAARRARIKELLRLVRMEAARELGAKDRETPHRGCRPQPVRTRSHFAVGTARVD